MAAAEKMAQLGISPSDVTSAIEKQNKQAPAGALQGAGRERAEFQYTARVKGRLSDVKEFENIIILAKSDGSFGPAERCGPGGIRQQRLYL